VRKPKFRVGQVVARKGLKRTYCLIRRVEERVSYPGKYFIAWGGEGQNGGILYEEFFRPLTAREIGPRGKGGGK
jgi:hypothetical protein